MMNKNAIVYLFLIFMLLVPQGVKAQNCDIIEEEIITLREPVYKTPMVWGSSYGGDGLDQIVDMVAAFKDGDEDGVIIAGNYTADEKDQVLKPFLARIDNRGKLAWEKHEEGSHLKTVKRLIKLKDGYAVLGDVRVSGKGNGFYIATYSKTGDRLTYKPVFVSGVSLDAAGFVETKDGKGFIVAARSTTKTDEEKSEAVLYRVNKSGNIIWHRKYSPGLKTSFNNIQPFRVGEYIMSGEIEQADGRMAAWLMSIDEDGALGWQRQYPRGSKSSLDVVRLLKGGAMIASGTVQPFKGTKKSGWVVKLDGTGTVLWQRYYSGDYRYEAKNVIAEEDGRFSVLLDAYPVPSRKQKAERPKGHSSLLTLSPRGYLLNVESFSDGQHAHGLQYIKGSKDKRIVAGTIQGTLPDGMDEDDIATYVFDGWIFAATSLEPYQDPCGDVY